MPDQPMTRRPPGATGLYDPRDERDACGVGFVVDIKGRRSHGVVAQGLQVLINLLHRGACGCEANTGDGAGILIQMPDRFLRKVTADLGIALPPAGQYGAGLVFLPRLAAEREQLRTLVEAHRRRGGTAGARVEAGADGRRRHRQSPRSRRNRSSSNCSSPPTPSSQSRTGRGRPRVRRPSSGSSMSSGSGSSTRPTGLRLAEGHAFYIVSLSSKTLIYKGMLIADQIAGDVPRSDRSRRRVGAGARASALQHQHVPLVAARASRTVTSRTTARSTRCAATSTGCARARGCSDRTCSATICRRFCRSSARAAAIRRRSTTSSSSW